MHGTVYIYFILYIYIYTHTHTRMYVYISEKYAILYITCLNYMNIHRHVNTCQKNLNIVCI